MKKDDQINNIVNFRSIIILFMINIDIKKFNLFKIHYFLQLLIIIVAMENKIADPSVKNWIHSHSTSLNRIRFAFYSWSTL